MSDKKKDKRPAPRPRMNPYLYQTYQIWYEIMEIRKKHTLRYNSAIKGKSNYDPVREKDAVDAWGERMKMAKKDMVSMGKSTGAVWDWLRTIKGLKDASLAAQLLAQIDYPAPFPGSYPDHCSTISKLWRFAGWGCIDGDIDRPERGTRLPYNKTLKAVTWNIVDQFIKQQTPVYAEIYYAEKERQRRIHPTAICKLCGSECIQKGDKWRCSSCKGNAGNGDLLYTPLHIHNRAVRKTAKIFLSHVWLVWREAEGLPVSQPWIAEEAHHQHIIPPPNWPLPPKGKA
jgi:hypothetical protein